MPTKQTHTHKYEKTILGGRKVVIKDGKKFIEKSGGCEILKCSLPGCTHWIMFALANGRKSICWHCEEELVLNQDNLRLKHPTHSHCRVKRERIA